MRILTKLIMKPLTDSGLLSTESASDLTKLCSKPLTMGEFSTKSNLDIVIEDGVAILTGYAGSETNSLNAERIAGCIEGVDVVKNSTNID